MILNLQACFGGGGKGKRDVYKNDDQELRLSDEHVDNFFMDVDAYENGIEDFGE